MFQFFHKKYRIDEWKRSLQSKPNIKGQCIFIGNAAANGLNYDGVFGEKTPLGQKEFLQNVQINSLI